MLELQPAALIPQRPRMARIPYRRSMAWAGSCVATSKSEATPITRATQHDNGPEWRN
jgi:hypothetical protein